MAEKAFNPSQGGFCKLRSIKNWYLPPAPLKSDNKFSHLTSLIAKISDYYIVGLLNWKYSFIFSFAVKQKMVRINQFFLQKVGTVTSWGAGAEDGEVKPILNQCESFMGKTQNF